MMIINEEDWDWHQKVYSTLHTILHLSADYWGAGGWANVKGIISKGDGEGVSHGGGGNQFILVVLTDHGAIINFIIIF
jgi:hypothetical protein